ncbi:MAG: RNA polymerase sigma factor [Chloroflexi bacterium]|nr:RNA polymerase sigma factor [Chloroflexota bacterium]
MDYQRVQQARRDEDALAQLYRDHVKPVYHYLLSRTGDQQDAEDLTTQTFMAALENLHQFKKDASFAAWIMGIARHKLIDHLRRKTSTVNLDDTKLQDDNLSPEEHVVHLLQTHELADLMGMLAPERAEALQLKVYGGLSTREVADRMGKSEGAVNNLVYRAIKDLRRWMND